MISVLAVVEAVTVVVSIGLGMEMGLQVSVYLPVAFKVEAYRLHTTHGCECNDGPALGLEVRNARWRERERTGY